MKLCKRCNNVQPFENFSPSSISRDKFDYWCKSCKAKKAQEYRAANPELIQQRQSESRSKNRERNRKASRDWKQNNPEQHAASNRKAYLRSKYGITIEQYSEMLLQQDHRCLGCTRHQNELTRRMAVDHCHVTGRVRGLLCTDCNAAIGLLKESLQTMARLSSYIERNKS